MQGLGSLLQLLPQTQLARSCLRSSLIHDSFIHSITSLWIELHREELVIFCIPCLLEAALQVR